MTIYTKLFTPSRVDEAAVFADRAKARTLLELNAQTPQPNWNKYKNYIPGMMLYMMKRLPGESSSSPKPVGPPRNNSAVPLSVQAIRDLLPDSSTAILQFVLSEEGSYLLVLTGSRPNQVKWTKFKLDVDTFILNDKIQRLNAFITNNANGYTDLCRELYDLLLKPAAELLKSKSGLIIIPDGVLWSLPFQALQPTANHFLLEDYNISYTSSLAVLARMQQLNNAKRALTSTTTRDVLAVGNPTFAPDQIELSDTSPPTFLSDLDTESSITRRVLLKPLPGAGEEAKLLMTIYGRRSVHSLIGPAASKETIMRNINSFRIIHLATHGILNFRSAFDSAIVLEHSEEARRRTRRGTGGIEVREYAVLLTAREVSDMKLRAELVVLSACDTAGGAISEGEGMVGLTWAFAAAGVPAVVASQWAINDGTTAELMSDFHQRLKVSSIGGHVRGTAAALRGAALGLASKKEYRHPYYWAGFIAVGDVR